MEGQFQEYEVGSMRLVLRYPPTPLYASKHAEVCVEASRNISGVTLDYSPASLAKVDDLIEGFRRDGAQTGQVLETLFTFGCYVGEVFARNCRGRWRRAEDLPNGPMMGSFMLVLMPDNSIVNPINKVFKKMEYGEGEDIMYFYHVAAGAAQPNAPTPEEKRPWWKLGK